MNCILSMKYISLHSNEIQEKWIPLWPFWLKCVQCVVDFYKPISLCLDINISGFSDKYKIHMLHLKISIAVYKKSRVSKNSISNIVKTFIFKILFYYRIVIISKYEKSYEYTTNDCENYHIRTKNVISYTCVCGKNVWHHDDTICTPILSTFHVGSTSWPTAASIVR